MSLLQLTVPGEEVCVSVTQGCVLKTPGCVVLPRGPQVLRGHTRCIVEAPVHTSLGSSVWGCVCGEDGLWGSWGRGDGKRRS